MERLCGEYAGLLDSDEPGSDGSGIYGKESIRSKTYRCDYKDDSIQNNCESSAAAA